MLRYVDANSATVWLQTDSACTVEILGSRTKTFAVCGRHFALVILDDLAPDRSYEYEVHLDGVCVWPRAGEAFPPSRIRLVASEGQKRLVFGSCRITRPHEPPFTLRGHQHPDGQGIDALRAYALHLARSAGADTPDLLLMLGDQIYADQPSPGLQERITARRERPDAPEDELADFEEYAMSYEEAWSDPPVRWLLSTVPTAMIFDDHEIHAEWRISEGWIEEMYQEPWFEQHIRCGLMAYWVFQHIGNLAPADLERDGVFRALMDCEDGGDVLASHMSGAGRQRGHSRWSFARRFGEAQLVVIDSRAGREVATGQRELISASEWEWVRAQASSPARHVFLATSVPLLLAPGLHHVQAWDEALTEGAWGGVGAAVGEWLRRLTVMDHWASFQRSFRRFATLLADLATGELGEARPASVVVLSGDVHHCYLAQAAFDRGGQVPVWQAVCSGFRKELAPQERLVIALGHSSRAGRWTERLSRRAGVPHAGIDWRVVERPAYANQIATLTHRGPHAHVRVDAVVDGDWRNPRLELAFARWLTEPDDAADEDELPTVVSPRVSRRSIFERNARSALIPLRRRRRRRREGTRG